MYVVNNRGFGLIFFWRLKHKVRKKLTLNQTNFFWIGSNREFCKPDLLEFKRMRNNYGNSSSQYNSAIQIGELVNKYWLRIGCKKNWLNWLIAYANCRQPPPAIGSCSTRDGQMRWSLHLQLLQWKGLVQVQLFTFGSLLVLLRRKRRHSVAQLPIIGLPIFTNLAIFLRLQSDCQFCSNNWLFELSTESVYTCQQLNSSFLDNTPLQEAEAQVS